MGRSTKSSKSGVKSSKRRTTKNKLKGSMETSKCVKKSEEPLETSNVSQKSLEASDANQDSLEASCNLQKSPPVDVDQQPSETLDINHQSLKALDNDQEQVETEENQPTNDTESLSKNHQILPRAKLDNWGEEDIKSLLKSFTQYCPDYVAPEGLSHEICLKVHQDLPHRSVEEIEETFAWMCQSANKKKRKEDSSLDKWFDLLDGIAVDDVSFGNMVSGAMTICQEEPDMDVELGHTDPDHDHTFPADFSKLYEYLKCVISGDDLPELTEDEAFVIEVCLNDIRCQAVNYRSSNVCDSFREVYNLLASEEVGLQNKDETVNKISSLKNRASILNPLGLSKESILEKDENIATQNNSPK